MQPRRRKRQIMKNPNEITAKQINSYSQNLGQKKNYFDINLIISLDI